MLLSLLHSGFCGFSCHGSNPSSSSFKALPILVLQMLLVLQVVVGAPGTLEEDSRMPHIR